MIISSRKRRKSLLGKAAMMSPTSSETCTVVPISIRLVSDLQAVLKIILAGFLGLWKHPIYLLIDKMFFYIIRRMRTTPRDVILVIGVIGIVLLWWLRGLGVGLNVLIIGGIELGEHSHIEIRNQGVYIWKKKLERETHWHWLVTVFRTRLSNRWACPSTQPLSRLGCVVCCLLLGVAGVHAAWKEWRP